MSLGSMIPFPFGSADRGDEPTASGSDQPDANFRQDVIFALYHSGIDVSKLPVGDLNSLVTRLWQTPYLYDAWANDPTSSAGVSLNMATLITDTLFSPTNTQDTSLLQTGLQLRQSQGLPLSTAQQRATEGILPGHAVTVPFNPQYLHNVTETFEQGDPGIDYSMPVGTPLYSPFSGTVEVRTFQPGHGQENASRQAWGRQILIHLDNGWTFGIGHVGPGIQVQNGQRITAGTVLGVSGGDVNDPEGLGGYSTGPHVELQWISPSGQYTDPANIVQTIYSGGAYDPALDAQYSAASSAWRKYFGRNPSPSELLTVAAAGTTNQQIEDYVRSLPSHIPGILIGQYTDLRAAADAISQKELGHGSTDGIVKELFDSKQTDPLSIVYWYSMHSKNQLGATAYNAAYAANKSWYQSVFNDSGADPRVIEAQAAAAGLGDPTASENQGVDDSIHQMPRPAGATDPSSQPAQRVPTPMPSLAGPTLMGASTQDRPRPVVGPE